MQIDNYYLARTQLFIFFSFVLRARDQENKILLNHCLCLCLKGAGNYNRVQK